MIPVTYLLVLMLATSPQSGSLYALYDDRTHQPMLMDFDACGEQAAAVIAVMHRSPYAQRADVSWTLFCNPTDAADWVAYHATYHDISGRPCCARAENAFALGAMHGMDSALVPREFGYEYSLTPQRTQGKYQGEARSYGRT